MDITYLGDSGFLLRGRDSALIVDPAPRSGQTPNANTVALSSYAAEPDFDAGSARVINRPGEYEVAGIQVTAVRTRRVATDGAPATEPGGIAYAITIDGVSVCHLGHLTRALTPAETEELGGAADVLLLPVGGPDTLPPTLAAQMVTLLGPKLVVPMLWDPAPDDDATTEEAPASDGDSAEEPAETAAPEASDDAPGAEDGADATGSDDAPDAEDGADTAGSEHAPDAEDGGDAASSENAPDAEDGGDADTPVATTAAPVTTVTIPSLEPFLKELGVRGVTPQDRLSVTPTNQPANIQVVVLSPRPTPTTRR